MGDRREYWVNRYVSWFLFLFWLHCTMCEVHTDQGLNPYPLQLKLGALTTGPPGLSLVLGFIRISLDSPMKNRVWGGSGSRKTVRKLLWEFRHKLKVAGAEYRLWKGRREPVLVIFGSSELEGLKVHCQRKEMGQGWLQDIQMESCWQLDIRA